MKKWLILDYMLVVFCSITCILTMISFDPIMQVITALGVVFGISELIKDKKNKR